MRRAEAEADVLGKPAKDSTGWLFTPKQIIHRRALDEISIFRRGVSFHGGRLKLTADLYGEWHKLLHIMRLIRATIRKPRQLVAGP
jgi:hypothetical protein